MERLKIRVSKIIMENIKNTEYGEITFPESSGNNERLASVLGIYGANGSGKTAVIYALKILKTLMSGKSLPEETYDYITKGKDYLFLKFEFSLEFDEFYSFVSYEFKVNKTVNKKIIVNDEKIAYKTKDDIRMMTLIDTTFKEKDVLFYPKLKYEAIKKNQEVMLDLLVSNKIAKEKRESFIFREETFKLLEKVWDKKLELNIISMLYNYAQMNLFVILDVDSYYMPFFFRVVDEVNERIDAGVISLEYGINELDDEHYNMYKKIVFQLSDILNEIIPGVRLTIKDYGKVTLKDGNIGNRVELMSKKGDIEIPIKYESAGIKKILAVLSALTAMFNNEGVLVAIDELDSGIFEYLLGALLEIINDTGSGQLIFTSHNLHPLELLQKDNIIFTTTNPNNRYIKLINVKETNNLRSFVLREVALRATGQNEKVFDEIKKHKISRAFRKAKKFCEDVDV